jgi:hypothetical protein
MCARLALQVNEDPLLVKFVPVTGAVYSCLPSVSSISPTVAPSASTASHASEGFTRWRSRRWWAVHRSASPLSAAWLRVAIEITSLLAALLRPGQAIEVRGWS